MTHPTVTIDGPRLLQDLDTLAQIGRSSGGSVTRVAYSPTDREGRAWVIAQLQALGLTVQVDAAGNTIALYPGLAALPALDLGSHTDSVPNGGRYDGALGVLAALACIRALKEANLQLRHPVEVINFAAEEATMSEGTFGSQAMAGILKPKLIQQLAWDGRPVAQHLTEAGLNPETVGQAGRPKGSLAAYLELHIEQGGILEAENIPLGLVQGIVGIRRYTLGFKGVANHAGTTPMAGRQDALVLAAPFIVTVRDLAVRRGIVGTVGSLRVQPGAPNVIPGHVELDVETRSLSESELDEAEAELAQLAGQAGGELERVGFKPPVESDPRLLVAMRAACDELGVTYRQMPSGAGHDAMCIAAIAPQAMLFVPSRGGISHSPQEFTTPEHCVLGAQVLLATLLKVDEMLDG
jgi:N-carbamoyl-L-amino-acid hydrolase